MKDSDYSVKDRILLEGLDDYVSASIIEYFAIDSGAREGDDSRALALGAVSEVIIMDLMEVVDLHDGVKARALAPAESVFRIVREWVAGGNEPVIGEIFWLRLTPRGREHAAVLDGKLD